MYVVLMSYIYNVHSYIYVYIYIYIDRVNKLRFIYPITKKGILIQHKDNRVIHESTNHVL